MKNTIKGFMVAVLMGSLAVNYLFIEGYVGKSGAVASQAAYTAAEARQVALTMYPDDPISQLAYANELMGQ